VTLLSVDRISMRYAYEDSPQVYPTTQAFADAVVGVETEMVRELGAAGCDYIHIDAPSYTAYVDEESLGRMRARGEDPQRNLARSIAADNAVVQALPDATFASICAAATQPGCGTVRGSYDAIAEQLFTTLAHGRYLLEYDDERSGGFEPLRFVPKGKVVVLGLISTKRARVESVDELRGRIEEAAKYIPLEQLALSPQCGFASALAGNPLDRRRAVAQGRYDAENSATRLGERVDDDGSVQMSTTQTQAPRAPQWPGAATPLPRRCAR